MLSNHLFIYSSGTPTVISSARPVSVKSLPTASALQPTLSQGRMKEEDTNVLPGRRVGPGLSETSIRGQSPPPVTAPGNGSLLVSPAMDLSMRLGVTGGDDRPPTGGGLSQQFAGTLGNSCLILFTSLLWYLSCCQAELGCPYERLLETIDFD